MRLDLPWVISILIGAVVAAGLLLVFSSVPRPSTPPQRAAVATPAPVRRPPAASPSTPPPRAGGVPAGAGATPAARISPRPSPPRPGAANSRLAAAERLLSAGRLRDAQEAYLGLLLESEGDPQALQGLVVVRRRLARDDPVVLRRQALTYRQAIATRGETEEHYTPEAMRLLAEASLLAALEIESERGLGTAPTTDTPGAPRPATTAAPRVPTRPTVLSPRPRATPPGSRPTPQRQEPSPAPPRVEPTPAPPAPSPTVRREATPTPSLDVNEPFALIQIGPVNDAARASEIAAELTVAGYAARVSRPGGGNTYFITLGPYRQSVVNIILQTIKARFGGGLPVTVTPAS